jgi:tetratricopeptide (TPR) repeat protein
MGQSFYRPSPRNTSPATYHHKASDSYFTVLERDGKFYQRRHQIDPGGRELNVFEKRIDFVMGSGNHARTYLHRTASGTLIELPLGWYADQGGHWAMNPGYDQPAHDGFRRKVAYECMFCHNAYPRIPTGHERVGAEPVYVDPLPEGIDCQRCHGPGRQHVAAAQTAGAAKAAIRGAIVNPARLSRERREEVCIQCHLESTSFPLPNSLPRYDRGPFGYRPGEPLSASWLFFDHAPEAGRGDKFELVNAVYRLRKSPCYLESNGAMECRTCHNPHDVPRGEAAVRHYDAACRSCHAGEFNRLVAGGRHTSARGCADCHMPKRRTEDVVHSLATDHLIQRHPPSGDLRASREERHETGDKAYRGEVVLLYPEKLAPAIENELYLALAQVIDGSNIQRGIDRLTAALGKAPAARPEFYLALAEAWRETGRLDKAVPLYREAVRRDSRPVFALRKLGSALRHGGQLAESATVLQRATALDGRDALGWHELGLTYAAQGKTAEAIGALETATRLDPDLPEPYGNLGTVHLETGNTEKALAAFREAIRIQPEYADAHNNLATLLAGAGEFDTARSHFEKALRLRPNDARTRYNFAMALGRARLVDESQRQLEEAVRVEPGFLDARLVLGDLLMVREQVTQALEQYQQAVRAETQPGRARLSLGRALAIAGDRAEALEHLQKAAAAADPQIREAAAAMLKELEVR